MRPAPAVLCAALLAPATGAAQPEEPPAPNDPRRALVLQADDARRAGDHEGALSLYTRAGQIRMTPSLRQMLAYESHASGRFVEAYEHATRCLGEAAGERELRERERIVDTCAAITRLCHERVARVIVRAPEPAVPGLVVRVAGRELPPSLWGEAQPVAPGAVVVDARSPDGATFRLEVTLDGGASREVIVALQAPPPPPPPPPLRPPALGRPAPSVSVGPWVIAGSGALALGAAGVLALLRRDARDDRDAACTPRPCRPESVEHHARYVDFTVATNVALGVGAALLVTGVTWYVVGRVRAARPLRVAVVAGPGAAALSLGGAF